jgi:hypothetical protein
MWKISMARSKALNSDQDMKLSDVFEYYDSIHAKAPKGWAARHVGEVLLNMDKQNIPEAENWGKKAIDEDKRNGTMWALGGDYVFYAALLKRKGEHSEAMEKLCKAIDIFKKCNADGWVEKYEKELDALA